MFAEQIFKIGLARNYGDRRASELDQVEILTIRAAQNVGGRKYFDRFRAESYPDVFLFSFWFHDPSLCGSCFLITNQQKVCIMKIVGIIGR